MHARWDAIDLANETWTLAKTETKNRKPLTIELTPAAMRVLALRERNLRHATPFVFPGRDLSRPRFDCSQPSWRALLKRAGLYHPRTSAKNFRGHDLRHTAISFMVMAGRSLEQAGATVGHLSVASTKRYAHLLQQVQRETALAGEAKMRKMIEEAKQKQLPAART
jgi:integrase